MPDQSPGASEPSAESSAAPPPSGAEASAGAKEPKRETIVDAIADLLQSLSDWLRQEVGATMREKVVLPLQKAGIAVAAASAAGCLAVIGLVFIAVGLFILLGQAIGYAAAFLLVGGVYLLGAVVFIVVRFKVMQR
jgi:hypothetical protein